MVIVEEGTPDAQSCIGAIGGSTGNGDGGVIMSVSPSNVCITLLI